MLQPPLHLCAGEGLVAKVAHGRANGLRREQARQHAPHPKHCADIPFGTWSLAPGIDVGADVLDELGSGSPCRGTRRR